MPALTTCPECHAFRLEGHPCPVCHWRPTRKPEAIDVADGELGLVDRSRLITLPSSGAADKLRFFRMLLYIAAERGYQRGWAVHKYRERFGAWPEVRFADPMPPDAAIRSWVRSRQIAFARAQAKAAGAA